MRPSGFLLLPALASLSLAACNDPPKPQPAPEAQAQTPAAAKPPPAPSVPSVATAGDVQVPVERFQARLKQYGPAFSSNLPNVRFLAEAMLDEELLLKEAERRGVDKEPAIAQKLDEYRRQILTQALLEKLEPSADSVTPEMVKEYFEKNPNLFKSPERIRTARIAFAPDQKDKAKEVFAKVKKGEPFAKLAKEFSRDTVSRENGGDIGAWPKGARPDLGDGPFTLKKKGDVGLFETPLEVNIVMLTDRLAPFEEKFDDPKVQERIRLDLRRQAQEKARQGILKAAKDTTPAKFDEEKLKGFVTPPAQ